MSEFRFACPHCRQRISGDAAYKGREITCPSCQKTLTVPDPQPKNPVATRIEHTEPPPPAPKFSLLALASLASSLAFAVGSIPGIICGHLAWARIKRNPALKGRGLAAAGLVISYVSVLGSAAFLAVGLLAMNPPEGHQLTAVERAANTPAVLAPRLVDEVKMDDSSETAHHLDSHASRLLAIDTRKYREGLAGGSFSYVMKVDSSRPMSLYCNYWGNDSTDLHNNPGRLFDIFVNDKFIATQKLEYNDPGHFFDVEYKIPPPVTRGLTEVTVLFQARPGLWAGRLFGCQTLRR